MRRGERLPWGGVGLSFSLPQICSGKRGGLYERGGVGPVSLPPSLPPSKRGEGVALMPWGPFPCFTPSPLSRTAGRGAALTSHGRVEAVSLSATQRGEGPHGGVGPSPSLKQRGVVDGKAAVCHVTPPLCIPLVSCTDRQRHLVVQ